MRIPKTPIMINREAYLRTHPQPKPKPSGKIDLSQFPPLASESGRELDATIEWLGHIAAGRING